MQLADMSVNDLPPWTWRYAWFPQDGASHLAHLLSLVGMMILWYPGESSRSCGYSLQATDEVDANNTDQPNGLVSDTSDGEEEQRHEHPMTDDDPLDSPMSANAVAPEPIGARHYE